MMERMAPEQHDTLEAIPEPAENTHLFGHAEAGTALAARYKAGALPHALIVSGPLGIGKATFAFHLAHHLLAHPRAADAPDWIADPDPATPLFRQIARGAHPSILHLTRPANDKAKDKEKGRSFKTVLSVDEVRRIGRFLSLKSHDDSYRVVIVDPADDMNANAANALLKNLEEPPSRTLFMLIVHSEGGLLPTIRSRCQLVRLSKLSDEDLRAALRAVLPPESAGYAEDAALRQSAGGSVRRAILLGQYGGLEIAEALRALVASSDVPASHKLAEVVAARGEDIRFEMFNEDALDLLTEHASQAALQGRGDVADRLAAAWQAARNAITDTDTYNLDRKQHALSMIERLNTAMRM